MSVHTSTVHLEPDELQRLLDGEGDVAEREYAATHLRSCASCAADMRTLEQQAALLSGWLERAAFEERTIDEVIGQGEAGVVSHWRFAGQRTSRNAVSQGWLRAAAVLVLLGTPVAVSSTVRGWIANQIGLREAERVTDVIADREPVNDTQPAGVIRFAPAAGSFEVVITSLQQEGTFAVVAHDGAEAVLEISGIVGAGPVVSEHELRINNDSASTASYTLRVPASLTRVIVRVAGRPVRNIQAVELREGAQILLRQGR